MKKKGVLFAVVSAMLYALNSPFSKLLLGVIPSTILAGLLYLGAGIGMLITHLLLNKNYVQREQHLSKVDSPFVLVMILLDIIAPISLLYGLYSTTAANASLLNNFEIVATSIIALFIFKECISKRLWIAIFLITVASILLSFDDISSLKFSFGSSFILFACICWGFENNCTKKLSAKNPFEIVIIKGFCSGTGSLIIALVIGERCTVNWMILSALLLGFVAYGLSIYCYINAQRYLGAAKTSAYYAISPFIGAGISIVLLNESPPVLFYIATILLVIGALIATTD